MSALPARVQTIINEIAERHEVSPDDITGGASTRPVEIARLECYRRLLSEPKPTGTPPSQAEVARWINVTRGAICLAMKDRQTAIELLEDAKL
jgi:hypothetical protein